MMTLAHGILNEFHVVTLIVRTPPENVAAVSKLHDSLKKN